MPLHASVLRLGTSLSSQGADQCRFQELEEVLGLAEVSQQDAVATSERLQEVEEELQSLKEQVLFSQ